MGFLKKLFGTAAVTGAAVGGALYVKKRKEEKDIDEDILKILTIQKHLMLQLMTTEILLRL